MTLLRAALIASLLTAIASPAAAQQVTGNSNILVSGTSGDVDITVTNLVNNNQTTYKTEHYHNQYGLTESQLKGLAKDMLGAAKTGNKQVLDLLDSLKTKLDTLGKTAEQIRVLEGRIDGLKQTIALSTDDVARQQREQIDALRVELEQARARQDQALADHSDEVKAMFADLPQRVFDKLAREEAVVQQKLLGRPRWSIEGGVAGARPTAHLGNGAWTRLGGRAGWNWEAWVPDEDFALGPQANLSLGSLPVTTEYQDPAGRVLELNESHLPFFGVEAGVYMRALRMQGLVSIPVSAGIGWWWSWDDSGWETDPPSGFALPIRAALEVRLSDGLSVGAGPTFVWQSRATGKTFRYTGVGAERRELEDHSASYLGADVYARISP